MAIVRYLSHPQVTIDRCHDQRQTADPGGGNWYAFDRTLRRPNGPWRPMETMA